MKKKKLVVTLSILTVMLAFLSCSWNIGIGDLRDRNLEQSVLLYLDSRPGVEYVGMTDTHELDGSKFQAVVIYNAVDTAGQKVERNARVTTNTDCSEIYRWEELNTRILEETKQQVSEKMNEQGLPIDGSLIDALINLKKHTR